LETALFELEQIVYKNPHLARGEQTLDVADPLGGIKGHLVDYKGTFRAHTHQRLIREHQLG
jgi:hypothetical protein